MIDFTCPNCGQELSADNADRGEIFSCPQCGENVQVPNVMKLPEKKKQISIRSSSQRECPFCGELIQKSATKCRYCGEWLMGKNRAPRSFAEEYAATTPQRVEKPTGVTVAVFLMFAELVIGWILALVSPAYRQNLLATGVDPAFAASVSGVVSVVIVLIIIGINTGHGWCRMLFLILTGIWVPLWFIGFFMCLSKGVPVSPLEIVNTVVSIIEFLLLASSSAGKWYRAVANGQKP